jgi:hypothetical protein
VAQVEVMEPDTGKSRDEGVVNKENEQGAVMPEIVEYEGEMSEPKVKGPGVWVSVAILMMLIVAAASSRPSV